MSFLLSALIATPTLSSRAATSSASRKAAATSAAANPATSAAANPAARAAASAAAIAQKRASAAAAARITAEANAGWADWALRLSGESQAVYDRAVRNLRARPTLLDELREALDGPQRALALDVITHLSLREMWPDLVRSSENDADGFVYLSLNSLIDKNNARELAELYTHRLQDAGAAKRVAPAAKMAMLDTLGRMNARLSTSSLERLLQDGSPEVRQAVVSYLRPALLEWRAAEYLPILGQALEATPYQLRIEALYLCSELPAPQRRRLRAQLLRCGQDASAAVRAGCRYVLAGNAPANSRADAPGDSGTPP